MDGYYPYKVSHPNVKNDLISGMKSDYKLPAFRAGGNQVPFYLGIKGNYQTSVGLPTIGLTASQKVQKEAKMNLKPELAPSYLYAGF